MGMIHCAGRILRKRTAAAWSPRGKRARLTPRCGTPSGATGRASLASQSTDTAVRAGSNYCLRDTRLILLIPVSSRFAICIAAMASTGQSRSALLTVCLALSLRVCCVHVRTYAAAGRAELAEYDKQVRKRIPKDRARDLPPVPGTDGASTDPAVVAERTRWIEDFFVAAFQYLDERMSKRLTYAADGKNTWERDFAKTTCDPLLPPSRTSAAPFVTAHEMQAVCHLHLRPVAGRRRRKNLPMLITELGWLLCAG
jgi:hypothetical protein